eukprot:UN10732
MPDIKQEIMPQPAATVYAAQSQNTTKETIHPDLQNDMMNNQVKVYPQQQQQQQDDNNLPGINFDNLVQPDNRVVALNMQLTLPDHE